MRFVETPLKGTFVVEVEARPDEHGFFARTFCVNEFTEHGLNTAVVQSSIAFKHQRGRCEGCIFRSRPRRKPS